MALGGVLTALITPFREGRVDEESLRSLVRYQIKSGINGLVALGTTGEGATLTEDESARVVLLVVKEARGAVPVVVYVGDCSTARAVTKAKRAEELGADALLVITPYYNCPPQAGVIAHFESVARATPLPLIVYHHPKRTGVVLSGQTIAKLALIKTVIGIKEGSADMRFAAKELAALRKDFLFFSGDDPLTLPFLSLGAHGVISVIGNLLPALMVEMVSAALRGEFIAAREVHEKLSPFFRAAAVEINPIPIKALMAFAGHCAPECRLPLIGLQKECARELKALILSSSLIKVAANG